MLGLIEKPMHNTTESALQGDQVLREIWRVKDALSAARAHDVDALFEQARQRERALGRAVVSFAQEARVVIKK